MFNAEYKDYFCHREKLIKIETEVHEENAIDFYENLVDILFKSARDSKIKVEEPLYLKTNLIWLKSFEFLVMFRSSNKEFKLICSYVIEDILLFTLAINPQDIDTTAISKLLEIELLYEF